MKPTLRVRPRLEALEDRWAPAVNIVFDGSNLAISGNPGAALTITQNASDVSVTDSFGDYGPYAVTGNISATLTNSVTARAITLALGANSTNGSVSISTGNNLNGNTVTVTGPGAIAGDFRVTGGTGDDAVDIQDADVGGSVIVNLGNQLSSDDLEIGSLGTSDVGGSVVGNGVDFFNVTDGSNVGGNVILNNASVTASSVNYFLDEATIGGSVFITTGQKSTTGLFLIDSTIAGNLTASLGSLSAGGSNTFTILSSARINGNVTVIGKNAVDDVTLGGDSEVLGNVAVHLGNNNDTLTLNGIVLGRSITFTGGNGGDTLDVGSTADMGSARLFAYLGNGVDTYEVDTAATLFSAYIDYGFGADIFVFTGAGNFTYKTRHRNK